MGFGPRGCGEEDLTQLHYFGGCELSLFFLSVCGGVACGGVVCGVVVPGVDDCGGVGC
jgi:hypothetical protein